MAGISRRRLLGSAAGTAAGAAALTMLPPNLRRAVADPIKNPGPLSNIEHVVILMQENRSFDHYFGTLQGVRGFSDPDALTLSSGKSVFYQPFPDHPDGYLLPFHLDTHTSSAQAMPSTSHSWRSQHDCWNGGAMDGFVTRHVQVNGADRGPYTMGYYERVDVPFHFALAQSFTICDAYHCSMMCSTTPNRLYLMTGMIDPRGTGGGPVTSNTVPDGGYRWTSYPEQLTEAGVSWHIYSQETGKAYNPLQNFPTVRQSRPGEALYDHALTLSSADQFEYDVAHDNLPAVSWILPTNQQSEHPDYLPAVGEDFVAHKMEAVAANPDVWAKTVFILTYDENDGLFDHVRPPTPPAGTADEFVNGEPIGAGFRVPCLIISPWTVGGYVATETFDHTSVLQFLERITGVTAANVSDWRRSTFGDLTSALGFSSAKPAPPLPPTKPQLWRAERQVASLPAPPIPGGDQTPPEQNVRRRTSTVPEGPDLPDKLRGEQPYYQESLNALLHEDPDDPQGYADMTDPEETLRALAADFTPRPGVRYAYAAAGGIRIADTTTGEYVKAVSIGSQAFGLAATPDGKKIYVPDFAASAVAVYDVAAVKVTTHVTVGLFPSGVAVSPNGRFAYVANTGPDSGDRRGKGSHLVSVIDTATDTVIGSVRVGNAPKTIAFAPDGSHVYVTCADGLYVVSGGADPDQLQHLTDIGRARGVAVTADGGEVWVVNPQSDRVLVLDPASLKTTARIKVGRNPCNVAFAGDTAYVTNANSDSISVVDIGTHKVTGSIDDVGPIPLDLTTAVEGQLWVTTSVAGQTMQAVDLATGKVIHTVKAHFGVDGITII